MSRGVCFVLFGVGVEGSSLLPLLLLLRFSTLEPPFPLLTGFVVAPACFSSFSSIRAIAFRWTDGEDLELASKTAV